MQVKIASTPILILNLITYLQSSIEQSKNIIRYDKQRVTRKKLRGA